MTYKIIYTTDFNATQKSEIINARNYTGAYLEFTYKSPAGAIILEIITED